MDKDDEILAELPKISDLLAKPPKPKGTVNEFKAFLSKYGVLGLAVVFILALYFGNVVKALVTDIIMPIISYAFPPGTDINTLMAGPFGVGDFANNVITLGDQSSSPVCFPDILD